MAGGAVLVQAGAPVKGVGVIGPGLGVSEDEASAVAACFSGPGLVVVIGEIQNGVSGEIREGDSFTIIVEMAAPFPSHGEAGTTAHFEGLQIVYDEDVFSRGEMGDGAFAKVKCNALGEAKIEKAEGRVSHIAKFDEFKTVFIENPGTDFVGGGFDGMIHQFGDDQGVPNNGEVGNSGVVSSESLGVERGDFLVAQRVIPEREVIHESVETPVFTALVISDSPFAVRGNEKVGGYDVCSAGLFSVEVEFLGA